jgi:hypothetical protein
MTLTDEIKALGSDHIPTFGGDFEGGYHIQQDASELAALVGALMGRTIHSYLQIGCAAGGTERYICEKLGIKDFTVIDLGQHPKFPVWLNQNKPDLMAQGVKVSEHIGDSHDEAAEAFLAAQGKKFDLIGIDGDHSPAGVRMDWVLIIPYLKPGTLVWFHDINSAGLPLGQQGALEVWEKLKGRHNVILEVMDKFGIGLVEII